MKRAAAFFDIDRTLVVDTSLESCFLRLAWQRRVIGPSALFRNVLAGLQALGLLPAKKRTRIPIPGNLGLFTRLRYAFFSGNKAYLRGLRLDICTSLARDAFREQVLPRLSPAAEERVKAHRAEGHLVVLLTGTLDFLTAPLQDYLQADAVLAARPLAEDGIFTGRLAEPHPYGPAKRELLLHFANERGLDLGTSYAYADHYTDLPFLEAVGNPVAVNPDHRLRQMAQSRGWRIEQFRSAEGGRPT